MSPTLILTPSCSGGRCGWAGVNHNGDAFVCEECGANWDGGYDGEEGYFPR